MGKATPKTDIFEQSNREYLALGTNAYERLRRSGLRTLDAIRRTPGWRDIPHLVQRFETERYALVSTREQRQTLKNYNAAAITFEEGDRTHEVERVEDAGSNIRPGLLSKGFDGKVYHTVSRPTGRQRKTYHGIYCRNAKTGEFVAIFN